ncbi:ankyrin repeat domain-containing protein [Poriferisphaera sp. WC338]|uniref:ankyrin repeat domain-containing protein n=1 Tax=Poriferisphaera sp. WC338 TaxID=3425129 RepID=UPI003D8158AA
MTDSMNFVQLIEDGDVAGVQRLLAVHGESVHRHIAFERPWGEELWLPLHLAAKAGEVRIVEMILDAGGNVDGRTRFTESPTKARATALHVACSETNVDVVRLLLQRGADVRARKADGGQPRDIAEGLIAAGHEGADEILEVIEEFEGFQGT